MGLSEQVKIDAQTFTSNKVDFGVDLAFKSPSGHEATVAGYYSDHSRAFDEMGNEMVGKKTTVVVSEQSLIDAGYPSVRTSKNLINLDGHLVSISYADGSVTKYLVDFCQPDYTINLITIFLTHVQN